MMTSCGRRVSLVRERPAPLVRERRVGE
uniref:Uncharacterized protein n=1 Tax=Arundo donax TaxID=35708 RepID=A0A0A9B284_ARUDO